MTATSSLESTQELARLGEQWVVPLHSRGTRDRSIAAATSAHEIFRFRFATNEPAAISATGVTVPLQPVGDITAEEIWVTNSAAQFNHGDDLWFAETADYQFCYLIATAVTPQQIRDQADIAYRKILSAARDRGYAHPIRAWNFFPQITAGEGDEECYRQFSVGRANAFTRAGFSKQDYPAGTAIGTRADSSLLIVLLSGKASAEKIENPRQISAYDYPRQYGPVSPTFARASLLHSAHGSQLLVSGTASIVGSDSCHQENAASQLEETLINVHTLATRSGWKNSVCEESQSPFLRVYLRAEIDCAAAAARIREVFGQSARVVFVYGDICRSDLLLEIESVFWIE